MNTNMKRITGTVAMLAIVLVLFSLTGMTGAAQGDVTDVVFLHHSVGSHLISRGDVRESLTAAGYDFWDHHYNYRGLTMPDGTLAGYTYNIPGDNTNPDGFAQIFAQEVDMSQAHPQPPVNAFSGLLRHDVIAFKSCYPVSNIRSDAQLELYKDYYRQIRDVMDQHPDKIFIVVTPPPLNRTATTADNAARAQAFANWLASAEFLAGHPNVFTFNFFEILDGDDPNSNYFNRLREEYQNNSSDSHPNVLADEIAGPQFVEAIVNAIETYHSGATPTPLPTAPPTITPVPTETPRPTIPPAPTYTSIPATSTATPTSTAVRPTSTVWYTPTPTSLPPFTGAVVLEDGACCVGGTVGETIEIDAAFEANSPIAPVTEMRTASSYGGGCLSADELANTAWEPFVSNKTYTVTLANNWIGFYVSAQYRDQTGYTSPVYCDDISVEGMPASPTPGTGLNQPDLIISHAAVQLESGNACYVPPAVMGVRVWVKNVGDATAGEFIVDIDGERQAVVEWLAPGEMTSVWFGERSALGIATVDATFRVAESNEDNNTFSGPLPVPTLPPPCTVTPTPACPGEPLVIQRGMGDSQVKDAYIWAAQPEYTGNSETLYTGMVGDGHKRSLLHFDLSAIPIDSAQITIVRATLHLQLKTNTLGTVNVHRATAEWGEDGVTWNSFGNSFDPQIWATFTATDEGEATADVTALLQLWVNRAEPNNGFLLDNPSDTDSEQYYSSESSELANRPRLEICYYANVAPPITSTPVPTPVVAEGIVAEAPPNACAIGLQLAETGYNHTPFIVSSYGINLHEYIGRRVRVTGPAVSIEGCVAIDVQHIEILDAPECPGHTIVIERDSNWGGVADAYIWEAAPDYTGNSSKLYTGIVGDGRKRALLHFDLHALPADAYIHHAALSLYRLDDDGDRTINVHRITRSWDETAVTWRNFGENYVTEPTAWFIAPSSGRHTADVTALVQRWVSGMFENYGMLLDDPTTIAGANEQFASSEIDYENKRPRLEICYTSGELPTPPPVTPHPTITPPPAEYPVIVMAGTVITAPVNGCGITYKLAQTGMFIAAYEQDIDLSSYVGQQVRVEGQLTPVEYCMVLNVHSIEPLELPPDVPTPIPSPICSGHPLIIQRGTHGNVNDAYIWEASPNGNGNSGSLYAGLVGAGLKRALLRFDLSEVPMNATLESAALILYQHGGAPAPINLHYIKAAWEESEVTWNSFAAAYEPTVASEFTTAGAGWQLADVTNMVAAWIDGTRPNWGMLLDGPAESYANFYSSEVDMTFKRPLLALCYQSDAPPPTPTPMPAVNADLHPLVLDAPLEFANTGVQMVFNSGDTNAQVSVVSVGAEPPHTPPPGANALGVYWHLDTDAEAPFNATITLQYPDAPGFDETLLRVYRWHDGEWIEHTDFEIDPATNTVTLHNVTGFSDWSLFATPAQATPTLTFGGAVLAMAGMAWLLFRQSRHRA